MSQYTTELRWLVETGFNIGLDSYPIFDEAYREGLNQKIINHYYFREIGLETAALFSFFLRRKMSEIMPFYNQLYESAKLKIEPLTRLDYQEDHSRTGVEKADSKVKLSNTENTTQKGNADNQQTTVNDQTETFTRDHTVMGDSQDTDELTVKNQQIISDTPQAPFNFENIQSNIYGTQATLQNNTSSDAKTNKNNMDEDISDSTKTDSTVTSNQKLSSTANEEKTGITNRDTTNTVNSTDNFIKKVLGNNASRTDSEMLMQWRETFLNIDMLVIEELNELFMGLY